MNIRRSALIVGFVIVLLVGSGRAYAQDKPRDGVAMGYPAAAGMLLNVGDRVALWPELVDVRHASTTTNLGSPSDINALGVGIRMLLYLAPAAAFRPYFVPQFDYTWSHTTQGTTPIASATTVSTYAGAASFGAQYALSSRFGVFGEVGLEYEHSTGSGTIVSHGNNLGTRNAVGVLVFFGG